MKFSHFLSLNLCGLVCGVAAGWGQSLSDGDVTPAEFPPAGYKASQYVDSRGCVFIRAGIDAATTWVPRVNRSRELICGQTPSVPAAARGAPQVATPAPEITLPTAPQPAPPVAVSVPKAKLAVKPADTSPQIGAQPATPAPKVAPAAQQQAPAPDAAPACTGASALSQQYLKPNDRVPLRCGPQEQPYQSGELEEETAPAQTKRPVQRAAVAPQRPDLPTGFRPAWEDGRLNPMRAVRTAAGDQAMHQIWTQTVPRQLVSDEKRELVTRSAVSLHSLAAPSAPRGVSLRGKGYVSLGTFGAAPQAQALAARATAQGMSAQVGRFSRQGKDMQIVLVGPYPDLRTQRAAADILTGLGFAPKLLN